MLDAPRPEGHWRVLSSDRAFALLGATVFAVVVAATAAHHEMWRDELDSWLVSRDAPSPWAIFPAIRYGGHPSLWYLLLWPVTRVTRHAYAMQVLNVAIATLTAFLVLRYAPGRRSLRVTAVFGYFLVYEFGTIARSYGLSVLTLVAACCVFPARRTRPFLLALMLVLAAHTSVHALILAAAMAATVGLETLRRRDRGPRIYVALAFVAVGIALSAWQMRPPADSGYAMGWRLDPDPRRAVEVISTLANAYLPIPRPGPDYWGTNLLAAAPGYWLGALVLAAGVVAALRRIPLALFYFAVATLGLLAFFYTKYVGYLRHHGFLWIALATAAWLAASLAPPVARRPRWVIAAFALLCSAHVVAAAIAVAGDWRYRFSAAPAIADLMRRHGVDRFTMVGARDTTAMAVVGHLDKPSAYYLEGHRFGSHIVFDDARLRPWSLWMDTAAFARSRGESVTLVADFVSIRSNGPPPPALVARVLPLGCERSDVDMGESYCVFVVTPG